MALDVLGSRPSFSTFPVADILHPKSPRWQALKGLKTQAEQTLAHIGGKEYARREMTAIAEANADAREQAGLSTLFSKPFQKVLFLGIIIADMPYKTKAFEDELLEMLPHKWKLRHPEAIIKKEEQ